MKYFFVKIFIDLPRVCMEEGKGRVPNAFLLSLSQHWLAPDIANTVSPTAGTFGEPRRAPA